MPKAISNTSPLLYLYRIGGIDWLPQLFDEVWTPEAVKNELQVGRDIYGAKGFKGFYSGSTPNLTRMILKNFYRFPLMLYLPPIFEKVTDNEFL